VGENPAETLARELDEEWSVAPQRLSVEALVRIPSGLVLFVGVAWLPDGAEVTPDDEHDAFAWWPAEVERWPDEADTPLRAMGALLAAA
jgi:8-oxo-dGTP diphosphatase